MKRLLLIILITFSVILCYSQQTPNNIGKLRKNAISFNFLGPTPVIGITYERILASKLSIEIGVGLPSIGLGIKIYPFNVQVNRPMFHVGVAAAYFASQESEMTPPPTLVVYLPIGVSVFKSGGFNFAIDLGPGYGFDRFIPYGNLKLGYRF